MMWVFAALVVLALGGVALVAAGLGAPMGEEYGDQPDALVPADRVLGADDLRRVRFPVVLRGYRMSDVDALVERLSAELAWRDGVVEPYEPVAEPAAEPAGEPADQEVEEAPEAASPETPTAAADTVPGSGPADA